MEGEQLKLELTDNIENDEIEQETTDIEDDSTDNLIYKNRLKNLVNEISKHEGLDGVQITKEGRQRIQQNSKYLISILIFEIIEDLKSNLRKQIKADDVDKALDKVLNKVSSIDNTILMLKNDIKELEKIKNNSVSSKVSQFINEI